MSRRTKLCITALFLVLLTIPVVYLTITWHPGNPLRFTIPASQPPPSSTGASIPGPFHGVSNPFYISVTNTSNTPIVLFEGRLGDVPKGGGVPSRKADFTAQNPYASDPPAHRYYWIIPPHGTIRCAFYTLSKHGLEDFRAKENTVYYIWCSQSKWRVRTWCWWLEERLPQKLVRHADFRRFYPRESGDLTTLYPAPTPTP